MNQKFAKSNVVYTKEWSIKIVLHVNWIGRIKNFFLKNRREKSLINKIPKKCSSIAVKLVFC